MGRDSRLQMAPDCLGETGLAGVVDIEHAVLRHERMKLLLPVGHAWRQRRDVPVHVGVALLAAQTEAVHPLGRNRRCDRSGHPVHDPLECQELFLAEISYPVLDMLFGCDQAVAEQGRIADEESNRGGILVYIVVRIVRVPGKDCTDKARTFPGPALIRRYIKRHLARLQVVHRSIVAAISPWQLARVPDRSRVAKGHRSAQFCEAFPSTDATHLPGGR